MAHKTIRTFVNQDEANRVASALKANGINSRIIKPESALPGLVPPVPGIMELQVDEADWARAADLIGQESVTKPGAGNRRKEKGLSLSPNAKKPWVALLFSFLCFGVGQIYCGQLRRGLTIYISGLLSLLAISTLPLFFPTSAVVPAVFILFGLFFTLFVIWSPLDAYRKASIVGSSAILWYSRWYIILIFLSLGSLISKSLRNHLRQNWLEPFVNTNASMAPNLLEGDNFYVNKRVSGNFHLLKRGELITFRSPKDPKVTWVQRVIALPGDLIEIQNNQVSLNGTMITNERSELTGKNMPVNASEVLSLFKEHSELGEYLVAYPKTILPNIPQIRVPEKHLFVMGDNRAHSYDSRYFGFLPFSNISGKPLQIYFSKHPSGKILWERIGMVIK